MASTPSALIWTIAPRGMEAEPISTTSTGSLSPAKSCPQRQKLNHKVKSGSQQGYLAYRKTPTPLRPWAQAYGRVLGGCVFLEVALNTESHTEHRKSRQQVNGFGDQGCTEKQLVPGATGWVLPNLRDQAPIPTAEQSPQLNFGTTFGGQTVPVGSINIDACPNGAFQAPHLSKT